LLVFDREEFGCGENELRLALAVQHQFVQVDGIFCEVLKQQISVEQSFVSFNIALELGLQHGLEIGQLFLLLATFALRLLILFAFVSGCVLALLFLAIGVESFQGNGGLADPVTIHLESVVCERREMCCVYRLHRDIAHVFAEARRGCLCVLLCCVIKRKGSDRIFLRRALHRFIDISILHVYLKKK
jgi:hypothetical protein